MKVTDLYRLAKGFGIMDYEKLPRAELEEKVLERAAAVWTQELENLSQAEREALTQARQTRIQVASFAQPKVAPEVDIPKSKSDTMRELSDEGLTVAQIAKRLRANYSFVYSVVKRYREEGAPERSKTNTKSDQMRDYFDQGMKVAEIAKKMNANYAFVYGVIKRYQEQKEQEAPNDKS